MALTLNQVIQRFQTYSDNHFMVNHFYYGDVVDFLSNGDVQYVACFLELLGTDISRTDKNTTFRFRLWFADLENVSVKSEESNQDIESDLTQIAQDYVSLMQYDSDSNSDFRASTSATLQYYREKFNDVVIAVSMDINVSTKYAANRCQVPTEIPSETTSYVYFGYKETDTILTQSQILASSRIVINNGEDYEINFGGSSSPSYLWFAQPTTEQQKNKWEDIINPLNNGDIGTEDDLFGSHFVVGQFDYVQTNYETQQENLIRFTS
jgi:hypothetical protein